MKNVEFNYKVIIDELNKYILCDVDDLCSKFGIASSSKSKNYILSLKMLTSVFGKELTLQHLEFDNILFKTIRLNEKGKACESMSFTNMNYCSLVTENWDNSTLKKLLSKKFLLFIFQEKDGKTYLKDIKFWKIPDNLLNSEVKSTWSKTKECLKTGHVIKQVKNGKVITFFPTEAETTVCHVRPHGTNGSDVVPLPIPDKNTGYKFLVKHSFWFNKKFIADAIINNIDILDKEK